MFQGKVPVFGRPEGTQRYFSHAVFLLELGPFFKFFNTTPCFGSRLCFRLQAAE